MPLTIVLKQTKTSTEKAIIKHNDVGREEKGTLELELELELDNGSVRTQLATATDSRLTADKLSEELLNLSDR